MEIYSTLTRSKEDFQTINDNRVNLFVCGPTVYDDAHIGHGRTYKLTLFLFKVSKVCLLRVNVE